MGNWLKCLCYADVLLLLILSVYTGTISDGERRKKSISWALIALGVFGFFVLQDKFNDALYALPKTFLLAFFVWFIFVLAAKKTQKYCGSIVGAGFITFCAFVVAALFGGIGVEYYTREEITKTVEPIEYYHVVKGAWPGNYIFQWGGVIYYYVYDDKTGLVSLDHVMAKDVKEKKFTEYEKDAGDPAIKWHTNMTYYKAPNWGEEVEKEAPVLPSLSNYRYYIELIVPEPDWPLN